MKKLVWVLPVLAVLAVLNGCGDGTSTPKPATTGDHKDAAAPMEHGGHEAGGHSHVSPHGGLVNSIGDYHVELVYDTATAKLTLYILGGDGTVASPIDAKPILGQFKVEGGSEFTAFTLNPAPQTGEKEGTASRFEAAVSGLEKDKKYELFVRPSIDGKSYRTAFQLTPGKIEHEDHAAKHGGTFFMASDNWHHLEGTLASATEFRLYLYDNFTKPVSAKEYEGTTEVIRQDAKGNDVGTALKLKLEPSADGDYLTTAIPAEYVTPLALAVHVTLQKGEKPALFNFNFDKPASK